MQRKGNPKHTAQEGHGRHRRQHPMASWWLFRSGLKKLLTVAVILAFFALAVFARQFWLGTVGSSIKSYSNVAAPSILQHFEFCTGPSRFTCVVDGDTLWLGGTKIRIADFDAPEISSPSCSREAALGLHAKQRLLELLNAGPFVLEAGARDEDKYGRKLRTVVRDGRSIGQTLIDEGLAHPWDGRKHSWCG